MNASSDEFLIEAKDDNFTRTWTRSTLEVSIYIADVAFNELQYPEVKVYNIFGGVKSDALYTRTTQRIME